jgi:hypothetical protein
VEDKFGFMGPADLPKHLISNQKSGVLRSSMYCKIPLMQMLGYLRAETSPRAAEQEKDDAPNLPIDKIPVQTIYIQ